MTVSLIEYVGHGKKGGRPKGWSHDRAVSKRFTVALTIKQYLALNNVAEFEGSTMTAIIRRSISAELRRIGAHTMNGSET